MNGRKEWGPSRGKPFPFLPLPQIQAITLRRTLRFRVNEINFAAKLQEPKWRKSSLVWVTTVPSSGPKSTSAYRLAIVQEVLLEAKFSFQVLNDSILCALNLLIRSYSSSSVGLLWKSPAGQKHKALGSLVRHMGILWPRSTLLSLVIPESPEACAAPVHSPGSLLNFPWFCGGSSSSVLREGDCLPRFGRDWPMSNSHSPVDSG